MFYSIRHVTRFRYSIPISESVSEVRMQPRSDGYQRCRSFILRSDPAARIFAYRDHLGNVVHHFNIPPQHRYMTITAESLVELTPPQALPSALSPDAWDQVDRMIEEGDYWEFLLDSRFAWNSDMLLALARDLNIVRRDDPLTLLCEVNSALNHAFDYEPQSTHVDSPIDDALRARRGVCQDFSHIMIALCRHIRLPARYVSGYLFHRSEDHDRSVSDATHAWVEVLLPDLGWVGFDPTNNLIAGERHIRAAIGRDYADVPPVRGVFRGAAESELDVAVHVSPTEEPPPEEDLPPVIWTPIDSSEQQQQQQQ